VADFYALAEVMEVAVFVVQGAEFRYVNPAAARMTGYTRDELLRMKFWEVVHPDERALVRERGFARQAGVDVPQHLPYRLYTKAGETLWVAFSGTRIDHEGEPAMLGTAIDISRHKQVEEALRRSEGRLRRLVDSNVLAVLISDLNGRILEPNDAFLSMLGYTRADLPLRWDELTPREWLPLAEHTIGELRNTGVATPFEKEYLHHDGHRVPVLIGVALLEHGGDECITFVIDLTKRKRLGFDLHDNVCQELTGVGMLLASVRHRLGARQTSLATDLVRAGDFLAEIVEHLRLMARELRPLQLRDLGLGESLTALAARMSSPKTSVTAHVPAPIPRFGDDVELSVYRVAQEALANALRHGHPRSIVVTLVAVDGRLRLEVRDDGCGFDPALRPRDALGLTGMEERALALGGRVVVTSTPGAGTTIAFDCPLGRTSDAPR